MSASFSTTGKHIISVGEDCRVYVWNYDDLCFPASKQKRSVRSCEHFFSEGVSVALQWPGKGAEQTGSMCSRSSSTSRRDNLENASCMRDSDRFSLGSWFSIDGPCSRGSATWPEEKLPLYEDDQCYHQQEQQQECPPNNVYDLTAISKTWGLVIVTAGSDGTIKTFSNYGLPVRL